MHYVVNFNMRVNIYAAVQSNVTLYLHIENVLIHEDIPQTFQLKILKRIDRHIGKQWQIIK